MAAQKGKDLLVKMHDGSTYVTVAGLRSRRIAFNAARRSRQQEKERRRADGGDAVRCRRAGLRRVDAR